MPSYAYTAKDAVGNIRKGVMAAETEQEFLARIREKGMFVTEYKERRSEVKTVKKVEDTDESHYPYQYKLAIDGMHCSNCARTVENELNGMDGVWGHVDLGRNEAKVLAKTARTMEEFAAVLDAKGYSVTQFNEL